MSVHARFASVLAVLAGAGCGDDAPGGSGSSTGGPTTTMPTESTPSTSVSASASGSASGATETAGSDTDGTSTGGDNETGSSSGGPANDPPELEDDRYLLFQGEMPLQVEAAGLLSNDNDPDGDAITVTAFDNPSTLGVTVDVEADGAFSYNAVGAWWGGPDGFAYTVTDDRGAEATANVEVLVVPDLIPLGDVRSGTGGFSIDGVVAGDAAGFSLELVGDVNDDGLTDILVGAPSLAGGAYVVFGKEDMDSVFLSDVTNGNGGFVLFAEDSNDSAGVDVAAAGDVNNDGLDDLLVAAPASDGLFGNGGRTYVVFGKADGDGVQLSDVVAGTGGFVIEGAGAADRSGNAVAGLGDINGDDFDDIAVGAWEADPNGGDSGTAYVVFGKADGTAVLLAEVEAGAGGFPINGQAAGVQVGYAVAGIGDFDGDTVPDILVGAPSDATNFGAVYVVFGKSDTGAVLLDGTGIDAVAIIGEADGDFTGFAVAAAGDVNDDGLADGLIVSEGNESVGVGAGRAYVVFGTDELTAIALGDVAGGAGGFAIDPPAGAGLRSASGAGDVNGDGLPDVIVGGVPSTAGRAYLVHGKADGTAVDLADVITGAGGFGLDGEDLGDFAGFAVGGGGDVNNDGLADILVAAPGFPAGKVRGRAYVVFGSPTDFD